MVTINRQLQLVECDILKDIDEICVRNGLTYYIIGGTLLGAVRHRGFIPWDDDIDIVMYRDDYNRFTELLQKEYSEKYFAQNFWTDKHYVRYVLKVRLNGTELVESYLDKSDSNNGIYVDVFPLDHVKKTDSLDLRFRGQIVRILFGIKGIKNNIFIGNNKIKRFLGKILRVFTLIIPNTLINNLFDYVCTKDNKKQCDYTTNFASHFRWKKQLFKNEVFGAGTRLEFEGVLFNAPTDYETVLKRLYGEKYMEMPPVEKRETHNLIKIDFGQYSERVKQNKD